MADRTVYSSGSAAPITGGDYMDNVAEKIGILFNAVSLVPSSVANSGNDYTLTIDPTLDGDVVSGMAFFVTPNATNTGAVRIRVTASNPYYDLTDAGGNAIAADGFATTDTYMIAFVGGNFVIYSTATSGGSSSGGAFDLQTFTASGTWTKPAGISDEALVLVECWGAGGGGSTGGAVAGGGGGGGSYVKRVMRAGDLGATETVTVGAGGTAGTAGGDGTDGGNTTFGAHNTGYGGGGGGGYLGTEGGGGGGGETGAGADGNTGAGVAGGLLLGSDHSGGTGGASTGPDDGLNAVFGGAGGGGNGANGGSSWYGGGGGAGNGGTGGTSVYGGAGGGDEASGSAPGGGGGNGGAGGAGKAIIRTIS